MKVIILAGGFGYRISEYTNKIPKPMITINRTPLLIHIINIYKKYGLTNFIISTGYKSNLIENYFKQKKIKDLNIKICNTGLKTQTGGRIKAVSHLIGEDDFCVTYGDGLSNINIKKLIEFHKKHKKIGTVTAVRPIARFGELDISGKIVKSFKEKPHVAKGWINGGFFVFKNEFKNYLVKKLTVLEKEPLEKLSKKNELMAFKHEGFWQCVDTKRDKDFLEKLYKNKKKFLGFND